MLKIIIFIISIIVSIIGGNDFGFASTEIKTNVIMQQQDNRFENNVYRIAGVTVSPSNREK